MTTHQSIFDIALESSAFETGDLRVTALDGREAISELYRFDVEIACVGDRSVTENLVPREPITLVFSRDGTVVRRVHGVIASVQQRLHEGDGRQSYRLRIMPRAMRLDLVTTQSVTLGATVPDILRQKLEGVGLASDQDATFNFLGSYPALELMVQFGETDLAFVSRRAEHLGISYFFVAEEGVDRMCFVDHEAGFPVLPGGGTARIGLVAGEPDRIARLEREEGTIPNVYRIEDYNYRTPLVSLGAQARLEDGVGGAIEYGAHVKTRDEADGLAKIRAEEHSCRRNVYRGESTIVELAAGHAVNVEEHGELPELGLLLTAVEHHANMTLPATGGSDGQAPQAGYRNHFEAVDRQHTFRPRRVTPRPTMPGFVTGVVRTTPGAAEDAPGAALDAEGRYLVQLHFETVLGKTRQQASHPMRLMQPFGGTGHGMHFPLRPGTEVVIGFANGDPDRPLILGAVPNAVTRSPVTGAEPRRNRIVTRAGVAFEIGEKE